MIRTDDPIRDYERWEAEQDWSEPTGKCTYCDEEHEESEPWLTIGDDVLCPACWLEYIHSNYVTNCGYMEFLETIQKEAEKEKARMKKWEELKR